MINKKVNAISQIAIIGLGLIGGSLGLALKQALGDNIRVSGADIDAVSLRTTRERGAVDLACAGPAEAADGADLVFMCVPMLQMTEVMKKIAPVLKPGTILSDVGSTKSYLLENVLKLLPPGVHFVPGHPMAGREKSGIQAADPALFQDKWYIIATYDALAEEAALAVERLIEKTGARVTFMDIAGHDWHTAIISHVPHVAAAAMVNLLEYSQDTEKSLKLAGGGFRDTTRIASSNADMWADILLTNQAAITDNLEKFKKILDGVIHAISRNDRPALYDFFAAAKKRRDELLELEAQASARTPAKIAEKY